MANIVNRELTEEEGSWEWEGVGAGVVCVSTLPRELQKQSIAFTYGGHPVFPGICKS